MTKEITPPNNAYADALNATVGRMGGGARMGPPPQPSPEEVRAQVERDWGPAGDEAAAPSEPPPQEPLGDVSPTPVPPVGPFRYIDMENFLVVTSENEVFPIPDMTVQRDLMMLCRNTVWFATNDKFIAMSEKYGLPLPGQEAPSGQGAKVPTVPATKAPAEVPPAQKGVLPVQPTKRKRKKKV